MTRRSSAGGARASALVLAAAVALAGAASAQSGGGYDLSWHTVEGGGATFSTGGAYSLGGTAGQPDAGVHAAAPYTHRSGFWYAALQTFTVLKDFSDGNPAAVTVTLTCDTGIVTPASAPASEAVPAVFTVTGFTGSPSCTATEAVPAGYTANQAGCAAVPLSIGSCTLVNTLNQATFTVAKDFSDDSAGSVPVTLACTSGTVSPASAPASEATPAVFTVTGFSGTPTCTASETAPPGYTPSLAGCTGVALLAPGGSCTIVNTAQPGTISVAVTTSPPDPGGQVFGFTTSGGLVPAAFGLSDGDVQTFPGVAAGTYGVAVTVPAGWILTGATCSDGSDPGAIDLARDESVACNFALARQSVVEIPALDGAGLGLLALASAAAALRRLRRRREGVG